MPINAEQERRDECRAEVRAALYATPGAAMSLNAIARRCERYGFDFSVEEIQNALTLLEGFKDVVKLLPRLGATPAWQITAEGMLHHERGE